MGVQHMNALLFQVLLVIAYCVVWTSESLVIHSARDLSYSTASVALCVEVFKFCLSVFMFFYWNNGTIEQVKNYAKDGVLFVGIAVIYTTYNFFRYYSLSITDPGTYRLFINSRVIFSGLLAVTILRKKLEARKWVGLCILAIAGVAAKWGKFQAELFPIIFILLTGCVGSLGGVYSEKILQKDFVVDVNLQNMFLYVFTILSNFFFFIASSLKKYVTPSHDDHESFPVSFFEGWTQRVVLMVVLGGLGGIITSLTLKYINNIAKEYANSLEMIFTAVLSSYFFGYTLEAKMMVAIFLVYVSLSLYCWEYYQAFLNYFGASPTFGPWVPSCLVQKTTEPKVQVVSQFCKDNQA